MRGVGIHTMRIRDTRGFGAMFKDQPQVGLPEDVEVMAAALQTSLPIATAAMVATAQPQYVAPLAPETSGQAMGVRADGTVGPVSVSTFSPTMPYGRAPRSVIPMTTPSSFMTSNPAGAAPQFDPLRRQPDIDQPVPLAQQTGDAQDGAQYPSYVDMVPADQAGVIPATMRADCAGYTEAMPPSCFECPAGYSMVGYNCVPGAGGMIDGSGAQRQCPDGSMRPTWVPCDGDGSHPASTTGGHWLGGLAVALGLVVLVGGGVALYRAVA